MTDLATLDLVEVAERIRAGKVSSVAVVRAALERTRLAQERTHCFLAIEADGALAAAESADRARAVGTPLGPLHGVPIALKDMFHIAGRKVRYGSRVRGDYVPTSTATVVERLVRAGAINLGSLNMSEFALGPTGHNAIWGDCRNALDPGFMAGGSSSGSAAAVAACAVYASLGSDSGGSLRTPAAANGVVGCKPTHGRVSRAGCMKLAPSIDVIGPMTRSVRDCARLLAVLAGHDPRDPQSATHAVGDYEREPERGIDGLRIGVPHNYFYDGATQDVRAAMEASLAGLEGQGARLVGLAVPDVAAMTELSRAIMYSEATGLHGVWLRERAASYSPQVRVRATTGVAIPASIYVEALLLRMPLLERFVREVFSRCDVLHTPTLPVPTPRLEEVDVGAGPELWSMLARLVQCSAPFNFLGLPAIAVPGEKTGNGMPSSVQLVGRPFAEGLLLRVAAAHERTLQPLPAVR
ncbi:MAG: amidase [Steroidobacteraceae bacterium]